MLRLKASTMGVPSDFHSLLYDIIVRSCSVFALRNYLTILHTMNNARLSTPQGILQEACHMMHKLISEKRCLPQSKKGSSFNTTIVESGSPGPATVFSKPLKDRKGNSIDCSPPGPHHPQSCVTENCVTEHWCNHDKCGRWGNHLTSAHEAWYSEFKARRATRRPPKDTRGQASAHQAAGTPTPQPSSVSTPVPTRKPNDRRIINSLLHQISLAGPQMDFGRIFRVGDRSDVRLILEALIINSSRTFHQIKIGVWQILQQHRIFLDKSPGPISKRIWCPWASGCMSTRASPVLGRSTII
jgi:hypothetical protein